MDYPPMGSITVHCAECGEVVVLEPSNKSPLGGWYEDDEDSGYGHLFGTCPGCGVMYHLERSK